LATSTLGDQCQGLGLASLPTSTVYHCTASSSYRNPNGIGWIPINFSSISFGTPFSSFPIDPINTTSSGFYYAYISGQNSMSSYEFLSRMESQKYVVSSGVAANDGGYSNQYYEVGKDLALALPMSQNLNRVSSTDYLSFDQNGLIGYWPLDEGQGLTAIDQTGNGNAGTWNGNLISGSHYTSGKAGSYSGNFDGSTNYVAIISSTSSILNPGLGNFSVVAWVKTTTSGDIVRASNSSAGAFTLGYGLVVTNFICPTGEIYFAYAASGTRESAICSATTVNDGNWHLITAVVNRQNSQAVYIDGVLSTLASTTLTGSPVLTSDNRRGQDPLMDLSMIFGSITERFRPLKFQLFTMPRNNCSRCYCTYFIFEI
jgi:hypothetical protein